MIIIIPHTCIGKIKQRKQLAFKSKLAEFDKTFPIHLWDKLLPQVGSKIVICYDLPTYDQKYQLVHTCISNTSTQTCICLPANDSDLLDLPKTLGKKFIM